MKNSYFKKSVFVILIICLLFSFRFSYNSTAEEQNVVEDKLWQHNAFFIDNLTDIYSANIDLTRVISVVTPLDTMRSGIIIYKYSANQNKEFDSFNISYRVRATETSTVVISISTDNENYLDISNISNSDNINVLRSNNIHRETGNTNVIYIKISVASSSQAQGCFADLNVNSTMCSAFHISSNETEYRLFSPNLYKNNWKTDELISMNNVVSSTLSAKNILVSETATPGNIIYKFESNSKETFSNFNISYCGRTIRNSYIKFYISPDNQNYYLLSTQMTPTDVYPYNDPGESAEGDSNILREITIPQQYYLFHSTVYIKIEILSYGGSWGEINNLYIAYKNTSTSIESNLSYTDGSLIIGNAQSETKRNLNLSQNVFSETICTSVGRVKDCFKAITFPNKYDMASFSFSLSSLPSLPSSIPIALEITEVHNPQNNAFGYYIYVNNVKVYFRTYEPLIKSQNTYFVFVDRSLLTGNSLNIKIQNAGNYSFSITEVKFHNDIYTLLKEQGFYSKMGVYDFIDTNQDLNTALTSINSYPIYKNFKIGANFSVQYISNNYSLTNSKTSSFIDFSKKYNVPVSIALSRWWGNTPYTPDGLGGYFGDLKYGQIIYNSSTNDFKTTLPNHWGNTYWTSISNAYSNNVSQIKIEENSKRIASKLDLINALSNSPLQNQLSLVMEWGSGYWENGDFSDDTISSALKDGVILNPADGLSKIEKEWFNKHVADYNELLALAYKAGLGTSATTVKNGNITAQPQTINNLYSHTAQVNIYPSYDDRIPLWTGGVTNNCSASSEMYEFADNRHYEYNRAFGKLSCVNLEMSMLTQSSFENYLRKAYLFGMGFVTMVNSSYISNKQGLLVELDNIDNTPAPAPTNFDRNALDIDYLRDYRTDLLSNPQSTYITSYSNLSVSAEGNVTKTNYQQDGIAVYTISDSENFVNGLNFYLEGKTAYNGKIKIYAGADINNLTAFSDFNMGNSINLFNSHSINIIDLSSVATGKNTIYVKIVLSDDSATTTTSLRKVKAYLPWPESNGQSNGFSQLGKDLRAINTYISYKTMAKRALDNYYEKSKQYDEIYTYALSLFNNSKYNDAISYIDGKSSEILPAKYVVDGFGSLGKYPINVSLTKATPAVITLTKFSMDEITFTATSELSQKISMSIVANGNYILTSLDNNQYSLIKTSSIGSNVISDENGVINFDLYISQKKAKQLPKTIEGIFKGVSSNGIEIQTQDAQIGEFATSVTIPYTSATIFKRRQFGTGNSYISQSPQIDDKITAILNDDGIITETYFEYGSYTGVITDYTPPKIKGTNKTNGYITMDNGLCLEINYNKVSGTIFNTATLNGMAYSFDINQISNDITVGAIVVVTFIPYSYMGSKMRILNLTQNYEVLLSDDYESDNWANTTYSVTNLISAPLDDFTSYKVIYPNVYSEGNYIFGSVTYKVNKTTNDFADTKVIYSGRAIQDDRCRVIFYVSLDNINWTKVEEYNQYSLLSNNPKILRQINISSYVEGQPYFYLKADLTTIYKSWACLDSISIINSALSKPPIIFRGYRVRNNIITNISSNTKISSFLNSVSVLPNAKVTFEDSLGNQLSINDNLGTATKLIVTYNNIPTTYYTVTYGDVDGDSNIDILDLTLIKKRLLKTISLPSLYEKAANTCAKSNITITDLINVKKSILFNSPIEQDPELYER